MGGLIRRTRMILFRVIKFFCGVLIANELFDYRIPVCKFDIEKAYGHVN